MKNILLTGILISVFFTGYSQDNGYLGGFQFKPILGSGVFSNDPEMGNTDSLNIGIQQNFGYSFGMTIRKQFTKILAVETGLRLTQRNFTVSIDSLQNSYTNSLGYRVVAYDLPFKAMVRLRSSDNSYLSISLGGQMDLYPSDVFAYNTDWQVQVNRKSWVQGSFVANLGWEIHPIKKGIFYMGLSYNQPFSTPYAALVGSRNSNYSITNIKQNGTSFALDFRYYFEPKKEKPKRKDKF